MKKIIVITLVLSLCFGLNAYALDTMLLDMREKLAEESQEINLLMKDSSDIIVLNSLWNTCFVTISQLSAYFFMVGIFNTVKEDDASKEAVAYLERWLGEIKNTNKATISKMETLKASVDGRTIVHIERLKILYIDINNTIDAELKKISLITKAMEVR